MRLIGIHGRVGSGKDEAFKAIEKLASNVERGAFADPLKWSAMASLGMVVGQAGDKDLILAAANRIKETGRITVTWEDPRFPGKSLQTISATGRQFLQWYGTEGHRFPDWGSKFGEDFWVDNLLPDNRVNEYEVDWESSFRDETEVAVITDVRFENEARRILDLGGEVWWINAEERLGPNSDEHSSEQRLDDSLITKTVDNNGSVELFRLEVKRAFNE